MRQEAGSSRILPNSLRKNLSRDTEHRPWRPPVEKQGVPPQKTNGLLNRRELVTNELAEQASHQLTSTSSGLSKTTSRDNGCLKFMRQ